MHKLSSLVRRGAIIFERDSRSWELSLRAGLIIAAVPIIIMLGMVAIVRLPELFVWITGEDSVMEWLQFLLLLTSCLIFARLGLRLLQGHRPWIGSLCLLIATGIFFVAGEEIAWGQRIFGWSTPEALEEVNVQQEITLHNISSAHSAFVYGVMLAGLYGVLVPLLASLRSKKKRQSLLHYLLVPPLCLVPAFFMPFGYRFSRLALGVDSLFPHLIFPVTKFSEVAELCLYFGLAVFAWLNLRRIQVMETSRVGKLVSENDFSR